MPLREAIDFYQALLDDEMGQRSQAQLDDQLARRGLFFGERPLCTVLRPRFLTPRQYRFLQGAIRSVMPAFAKAYRAALSDPAVRAAFMLANWEEQLIQVDPGFRDPSPTARMDSFFVTDPDPSAAQSGVRHEGGGDLCFTEYNAETPSAPGYNDVLSEVFYGLPIMRAFERRYEVTPLPGRHQVLHALLDSYRRWGGQDRPRIAILDWREVPTYSEFVIFEEYFRAQGLECAIVDPREVEYDGGRLRAADLHITLIYKRVLLSELVARGGVDHPVIRAVSDHAACMVNPFRCKILHKKASLAVLSDEANSALFNADDRRAIDAYVPWTRRLAERHTVYDGRRIDLIPFLLDHRDDFVLKPNDEYGGKGIVLGWEVSASEWEEAIRARLDEPTIVQRRVVLPSEPYPSLVDGRVQVIDRMLDTDPFIWYGDFMSCCLTRLSTAALLNVTAGGGSTVPTFLVEERE